MRLTDRAWAEISCSALAHNAGVLQGALRPGAKLMAVVKADGYGHGAVLTARCLEARGVDAFAVATADEAIALRCAGIKGRILVLGYTPPARAAEYLRHELEITVVSLEHGKALQRTELPLTVQIKVDSGMHRLGILDRDVESIAGLLTWPGWRVSGLYTHLCMADELSQVGEQFTREQLDRFQQLCATLHRQGIALPQCHAQSSYGILNYPDLSYDLARPGIALYGSLSSFGDCTRVTLPLRPALALKARVAALRPLEAGEGMGYGLAHVAGRPQTIALLPIGYADGYPRSMGEQVGHVLIRGVKAPVAGRICMDQMMVDVSGVPGVQPGDVATLIGEDGQERILAEEIAHRCGTITNEIFTGLGGRLPRIQVD